MWTRVAASTDDAKETSAGVVSTTGSLNFGSTKWVGMRFRTITVPKNATITRAFLMFHSNANDSDGAAVTIYAQAADSAAAFTTASGNISTRSRTTASASWSPISSWSNNGDYVSVDIADVIQEVVNRTAWVSGNNLAVLMQSSAAGDRSADSYDNSSSDCPLIWIEYTPFERPASPDLLYVVTDSASLTAQETKREEWLKWWAYRVTRISAKAAQPAFNSAAATNDVAYVSETITSTDLNIKLKTSSIGIVTDEPALMDDFAISTSAGTTLSNAFSVAANSHYITSPFSVGTLALFSSTPPNTELAGTLASEGLTLGSFAGGGLGLITIEAGGQLADSTKAAGRRVVLPWGTGADMNLLNSNGQTLMRRSLEWAGGLRAWYKLNETSGTTAADSSTNATNATISGTPGWITAGRLDGATTLNGSSYFQAAGLMGNPKNVTIAGWANLTAADSSGAELISLGDCLMIRLESSATTRAGYYNGSSWPACSSTGVYVRPGWHHYAAVFDDTNNVFSLYIDGWLAQTLSTSDSISYAGLGSNTFIGKHGNGSSTYDFTGSIDDVRIYNHAMTSAEIRNLKRIDQVRGVRVIKWLEQQ